MPAPQGQGWRCFFHGCPSRQMSAIPSLGPMFSLFAFAYAKGKTHPSKSHQMLIRLHIFKKDRIYPSVSMLIPFFFFPVEWKRIFILLTHVQLKFNTIYCLNSLFLKYTSLCRILTPTGCIFWKAFTMAEVAAFSLHIYSFYLKYYIFPQGHKVQVDLW